MLVYFSRYAWGSNWHSWATAILIGWFLVLTVSVVIQAESVLEDKARKESAELGDAIDRAKDTAYTNGAAQLLPPAGSARKEVYNSAVEIEDIVKDQVSSELDKLKKDLTDKKVKITDKAFEDRRKDVNKTVRAVVEFHNNQMEVVQNSQQSEIGKSHSLKSWFSSLDWDKIVNLRNMLILGFVAISLLVVTAKSSHGGGH